jgi:lipopolysaccharide biosynthesis glycosyltransferase/tetratricopeptide (TPR) repeat protein
LRKNPIPKDRRKVEPQHLLAWAKLASAAGDIETARSLYIETTKADPKGHLAHYELGRLAQQAGDLAEAGRLHAQAAALAPLFPWAFYELFNCSIAVGDAFQAERGLAGFVAAASPETREQHISWLSDAAGQLYARQRRDVPWLIYEYLHEKGIDSPLIRIRRAERLIALRRFHEAILLLDDLKEAKDRGANDWGVRSLATAYSAVGRLADAAQVLSGIVARSRGNRHFLRDYLIVLHRLHRGNDAETALTGAARHLDEEAYFELRIAHLTRARRARELQDLLRTRGDSGSKRIANEILDGIFAVAYVEKDYPAAHTLIEIYEKLYGETVSSKHCKLNIAFATQVWSDAEKILATIDDAEFAGSIELRVKRFEYLCFTRNMAAAKDALQALEPVSDLPAQFMAPVLRYYGEVDRWYDLYQLGITRIGEWFNYDEAGYLLFRAIRKTGSHALALTEIERIDHWELNTSLRRLRTIVMEDMVHNGYMLEELLNDPNVAESEALQHRLFFKMRVLRGEQDEIFSKDYAIYFCTNESYFCGTMVALTSLVENNRELMEDADLFVVVDDAFVAEASDLLMNLGTGLDVQINVVGSSTIIPDGTAFRAGYGLFTGGQTLADAAYYRIFAAKYLLSQRKYKRGLYIDSDTVVLGGLERLFWLRSDAPIMARPEILRPEVVSASQTHGLEIGSYFNSGVLYLDFTHHDITARLERTIAAVRDPESKLIFQDQCALNLGFRKAYSPLRDVYNFFVKPNGDGDVTDGVILHFLDRPKPWDPAYPGAICRVWYTYWHKLSRYIGSKEALRLYRATNRG